MKYKEHSRNKIALNQKWSNIFLVFLLLVRILDQDLAIWIFGANVPLWVPYWYNGIAYILTATIVWLNRHELAKLNIDRPFVVILILGGILFALRPASGISVFVGITAVLILWAYINNQFGFSNLISYPKEAGILILLSILLALAPILVFSLSLEIPLSLQTITVTFMGSMQSFLATIVFEEVIFRGALWAYLRSLELSEKSVFCFQILLFWISHHRFLLLGYPYLFWVAVPCIAILLGLLVWRSKSLTPSTISHFLYNFISQLLLSVY